MTQAPIFENVYQEEIYSIKEKVLVIISKPWEQIVLDDRILLSKILGSVKLSLASVQIKVCAEFSIEDFDTLPPDYMIAFGAGFKNSAKKYEQLTMENTSIVVADELGELDDLKKRSLWLALKQIFR